MPRSTALFAIMMPFMPTAIQAQEARDCPAFADLAESIMQDRQTGDMVEMMERYSGTPEAAPLILLAFEQPAFSSDDYRDRAVQEFRNGAARACYSAE